MFKQIFRSAKDEAPAAVAVARWAIFLFLLIVALTAVYLWLWPGLRDMWYQGFRSSNEYITTKQNLLFNLMEKHEELEAEIAVYQTNPENTAVVAAMRGQQEALVDRMEREAALLKPDQVPAEIVLFLSNH